MNGSAVIFWQDNFDKVLVSRMKLVGHSWALPYILWLSHPSPASQADDNHTSNIENNPHSTGGGGVTNLDEILLL